MKRCLMSLIACLALLSPPTAAQDRKARVAVKTGTTVEELVLAGKVPDAVKIAARMPGKAEEALAKLMAKADLQITDRKIGDAQETLKLAGQFADSYLRIVPKAVLPRQALKGRQLRLQGIQQSDVKEYAKAETTLKEALNLSIDAKDTVLECGVHNSLGFAIQFLDRMEDAAKEFDTARRMAEEQKDSWRAASYNYNLGRALLELRQFEDALAAFRRSTEQGQAAGKPDLEARSLLMQGTALSKINTVSAEALRFFDKAYQLFFNLGDNRNAGLALYLMADHTAYTQSFQEAASIAERAVPLLAAAGFKPGLLQCYEFLVDMYSKAGKKEKVDQYRKLADEIQSQIEKPPNP